MVGTWVLISYHSPGEGHSEFLLFCHPVLLISSRATITTTNFPRSRGRHCRCRKLAGWPIHSFKFKWSGGTAAIGLSKSCFVNLNCRTWDMLSLCSWFFSYGALLFLRSKWPCYFNHTKNIKNSQNDRPAGERVSLISWTVFIKNCFKRQK